MTALHILSTKQISQPNQHITPLGFFFRLSQRPVIVAVWYSHLKSRPVRCGCHFMVRYDPDQDLGLFGPKQYQPQ